jgi:hypothetical protein
MRRITMAAALVKRFEVSAPLDCALRLRRIHGIRRSTPPGAPKASVYARDPDRWPRPWMGVGKDVPPGEELVVRFRPFIGHLASSGLSPKAIRRHVDNLWRLGAEISAAWTITPLWESRRPANYAVSALSLSPEAPGYPQILRKRLKKQPAGAEFDVHEDASALYLASW